MAIARMEQAFLGTSWQFLCVLEPPSAESKIREASDASDAGFQSAILLPEKSPEPRKSYRGVIVGGEYFKRAADP